MSSLLKSSWIYFLIFFITLSFGQYLNFRFHHPVNSYQELFTIHRSSNTYTNHPCKTEIVSGIPNTPLPDGNIRINFICQNGDQAYNYLRLGAVKPPTLKNVINTISEINNLNYSPSTDIRINGVPTQNINTIIKINDTIDVHLN